MAFPPGAAVLRAPDAGSGMGSADLARLHGLFAAYKPPGLKWKHLRDTVELQLLKGECIEPVLTIPFPFPSESISASDPCG